MFKESETIEFKKSTAEVKAGVVSIVALPINIEQLLHGRVVETKRLEFKEGWNPQAVLHTMCAFANDVPFDDRVNHKATIKDLNARLIEEYLYAVKSALLKEVSEMSFENLCRRLNIVEGPSEHLKPKNVGLMLFSSNPQKYFSVAQIDVVKYKDEVGDDLDEKIFLNFDDCVYNTSLNLSTSVFDQKCKLN